MLIAALKPEETIEISTVGSVQLSLIFLSPLILKSDAPLNDYCVFQFYLAVQVV